MYVFIIFSNLTFLFVYLEDRLPGARVDLLCVFSDSHVIKYKYDSKQLYDWQRLHQSYRII